MKTIHKFELEYQHEQDLAMPTDAKILSIQVQGHTEKICVWAEVEVGRHETYTRIVHIVGTGHNVPEVYGKWMKYLATVQVDGGKLVYHIYEEQTVAHVGVDLRDRKAEPRIDGPHVEIKGKLVPCMECPDEDTEEMMYVRNYLTNRHCDPQAINDFFAHCYTEIYHELQDFGGGSNRAYEAVYQGFKSFITECKVTEAAALSNIRDTD